MSSLLVKSRSALLRIRRLCGNFYSTKSRGLVLAVTTLLIALGLVVLGRYEWTLHKGTATQQSFSKGVISLIDFQIEFHPVEVGISSSVDTVHTEKTQEHKGVSLKTNWSDSQTSKEEQIATFDLSVASTFGEKFGISEKGVSVGGAVGGDFASRKAYSHTSSSLRIQESLKKFESEASKAKDVVDTQTITWGPNDGYLRSEVSFRNNYDRPIRIHGVQLALISINTADGSSETVDSFVLGAVTDSSSSSLKPNAAGNPSVALDETVAPATSVVPEYKTSVFRRYPTDFVMKLIDAKRPLELVVTSYLVESEGHDIRIDRDRKDLLPSAIQIDYSDGLNPLREFYVTGKVCCDSQSMSISRILGLLPIQEVALDVEDGSNDAKVRSVGGVKSTFDINQDPTNFKHADLNQRAWVLIIQPPPQGIAAIRALPMGTKINLAYLSKREILESVHEQRSLEADLSTKEGRLKFCTGPAAINSWIKLTMVAHHCCSELKATDFNQLPVLPPSPNPSVWLQNRSFFQTAQAKENSVDLSSKPIADLESLDNAGIEITAFNDQGIKLSSVPLRKLWETFQTGIDYPADGSVEMEFLLDDTIAPHISADDGVNLCFNISPASHQFAIGRSVTLPGYPSNYAKPPFADWQDVAFGWQNQNIMTTRNIVEERDAKLRITIVGHPLLTEK